MNEEESVLGLLHKQLEEEKAASAAALNGGSAKDYAEYRWLCGNIYGLAVAQARINEMVDRLRRQSE